MLEKLESLETKYNELNDLLSDPAVIADQSKYQKYAKAYSDLGEIVSVYQQLKAARTGIEDARSMLREDPDEEFKTMLLTEIEDLEAKKQQLEQRVKVLLLPTDPNDEKSVIMEIRAGTGGEEAALFAADLFRMYTRYAEIQGWK
jgi:peptide chain release factor 1